jgi:response regulator RpfG family c-di-GMP phosphodiesterase
MRHRDQRFKYLLVLLSIEAVCIAAGLWIHSRLILSAMQRGSDLAGWLPIAGLITGVWMIGLMGVALYMVVTRFFDIAAKRQVNNEEEILRRMQSLVRMRDAVLFGLAKLTESRDDETGHHLERVCAYSACLATALRNHPQYRRVITPEYIKLIGVNAALHDIGKVGIEDAILLKPGKLTGEERRRMQEHTVIGERCLAEIERRLGACNFLQMARDIVLCHQERWDGCGYPNGLLKTRIPLAARIVAVADVYDALASRRVYKAALPHEQCVEVIRAEAGKQFDPEIVETFLKVEKTFREINRRYRESGTADSVSPPPGPSGASREPAAAGERDSARLERVLQ